MTNDKVRLMIEVSEDTINECKVLFGQGYANNAEYAISQGIPYNPPSDCENCDFRKFTEKFVDGVVEVMNENGITSVEQLSKILKGGAE